MIEVNPRGREVLLWEIRGSLGEMLVSAVWTRIRQPAQLKLVLVEIFGSNQCSARDPYTTIPLRLVPSSTAEFSMSALAYPCPRGDGSHGGICVLGAARFSCASWTSGTDFDGRTVVSPFATTRPIAPEAALAAA